MIHAGNHFRVVIDGETAAVVPRTTTSEIRLCKANVSHIPQGPAMMTGVTASVAVCGTRPAVRIASALLALTVLAAGGAAIWYRQAYNVWPGQGASGRVHWCGRDYQNFGGRPQTWQQISSQQRLPIRPAGQYPPLDWSRHELFAAATPQAQRTRFSPPLPCAIIVYLRAGPGEYQPYSLEGGP